MELYRPRKLTFKAWNKEEKLLIRLDSISCSRGELIKKDHIILQYTGLNDKNGDELFEMDVVLVDSSKYLIQWSAERCGWCFGPLQKDAPLDLLSREVAGKMYRLCSYFESAGG